jgi:hypothetical protein
MKKTLKIVLYFIFAYVLTQALFYLLSKDNFFTSPMYILLPIFAFISMLVFTPIIKEYTKWNEWTILGLFIVIGIICYALVVWIFAYEVYKVLNQMALPKDLEIWKQLTSSAFLGFIVSGAIGIIAAKKK